MKKWIIINEMTMKIVKMNNVDNERNNWRKWKIIIMKIMKK